MTKEERAQLTAMYDSHFVEFLDHHEDLIQIVAVRGGMQMLMILLGYAYATGRDREVVGA